MIKVRWAKVDKDMRYIEKNLREELRSTGTRARPPLLDGEPNKSITT